MTIEEITSQCDDLRALVVVAALPKREPTTGGEQRRAHLVKAVRAAFPTDVYGMLPATAAEILEAQHTFDVRCGAAPRHPPKASKRVRALRRIRQPRLPSGLLRFDHTAMVDDFRSFAGHYDVTMVERLEDYLVLMDQLASPIAVDFDDLGSDLLRQQWHLHRCRTDHANNRPSTDAAKAPSWLQIKQSVQKLVDRHWTLLADSLRWRYVERQSLRRVDLGLFSNESDRLALNATSNAVLVPNGVERVTAPVGRRTAASPPTIGFWGAMGYEPNRDAAEYLLTDIWPRLQNRRPDVQLLIAGRGSDALDLEASANVTCTGFVPNMATVLSRLDVALVPLRLGVGTRIKIVEAWAHGIPVVSTRRGAFGLEHPGESGLLIADEPDDMVAAILEAAEVETTRSRLIAAGFERAAGLSWDQIDSNLTNVLRHLAGRRVKDDG